MRLIEHKVMQSKGGNWFAGCHTIEAMRRNGRGSGIVMRIVLDLFVKPADGALSKRVGCGMSPDRCLPQPNILQTRGDYTLLGVE